jgi:hypothetical protein
MATRYQVIAQSAPSATTATTFYTVPALKEVIISTLVVANRSAGDGAFRIAVRPAGATLANEHYIAYDVAVGGGDSTTLTLGITLGASDVVTIYASNANLSFTAFGSIIDF